MVIEYLLGNLWVPFYMNPHKMCLVFLVLLLYDDNIFARQSSRSKIDMMKDSDIVLDILMSYQYHSGHQYHYHHNFHLGGILQCKIIIKDYWNLQNWFKKSWTGNIRIACMSLLIPNLWHHQIFLSFKDGIISIRKYKDFILLFYIPKHLISTVASFPVPHPFGP